MLELVITLLTGKTSLMLGRKLYNATMNSDFFIDKVVLKVKESNVRGEELQCTGGTWWNHDNRKISQNCTNYWRNPSV